MPKQIISEILSRYSPTEVADCIKMIKQQNLEQFPDEGSVPELKKQQFILEHLGYLFAKLVKKGNS